MTYDHLAYAHLATIVPAFAIGTALLFMKKGTPRHKLLGRIYLPLMLVTAVITLLMPAQIGPRFLGHFGLIHGFSALVLYSVPTAYAAVRRGDIARHRRAMVGLYVGGIILAGTFAFMPGRLLHRLLF